MSEPTKYAKLFQDSFTRSYQLHVKSKEELLKLLTEYDATEPFRLPDMIDVRSALSDLQNSLGSQLLAIVGPDKATEALKDPAMKRIDRGVLLRDMSENAQLSLLEEIEEQHLREQLLTDLDNVDDFGQEHEFQHRIQTLMKQIDVDAVCELLKDLKETTNEEQDGAKCEEDGNSMCEDENSHGSRCEDDNENAENKENKTERVASNNDVRENVPQNKNEGRPTVAQGPEGVAKENPVEDNGTTRQITPASMREASKEGNVIEGRVRRGFRSLVAPGS